MNANKNTLGGTITLKGEIKDDLLKIYIIDNGKGLNGRQINDFIDIERTRKDGQLGSVIVLEMLKKIDGKLMIESTPGNGSTFMVQLPK